MSSMSPQVSRSATSIYGGIVAAVTTIAVSIILFRKLRETGNKSQNKGASKQGHGANTSQPRLFIDQDARDEQNFNISIPGQTSTTVPRPQPVVHSAGDEGQLDFSGPSNPPRPLTASEPQFVDQENISIMAQAPATPRSQPVVYSARDEGPLDISVPSHTPRPPTTSEPQSVDQENISIMAQAPATPRSQPIVYSAGDEGQLDFSVPSHPPRPPTTSEPQSIDQDNISIPAQVFTTPRPQPVDHFVEDEGQLDNSVPPHVPPTILESQFINQDARDESNPGISILAQASTLRPHEDIGSDEVPSISFSQGSSNVQISETNANAILNGEAQFTKIQKNLICDCIANLPEININLKEYILTQSITTLPRTEAGSRNGYQNKKRRPCLKGTRVALLREMADCITGSSESRMYILSGLGGKGKSTVAYTIASRAADLNLLGAEFFFSRDEADCNNAKRFFITIAYQLCVHNETFAKAIGDVLKTMRKSAATMKNPQDQLQALILDPLRSIVRVSRFRPILLVVDALDECDEEDAFSVLTGLSQLVQELPPFRVILTTRPQLSFDRFWGIQDDHKFFHLQDIDDMVVDSDIRLYLKHNLSMKQVQKRCPMRQWCASDEEIDTLICIAGKFFIIASTAVRYILDKTADPAAQMQKLLHCHRASAQDHTHFKDLDRFYTVILRDVVPEDCDDNDIVSRYQSVVGTIIFVQHQALPISTLAHLIGINVEEIHVVLDKLQSVIFLGGDDVPRVYHKSFFDYLTDQARCKDPHLLDPRILHTQIATRCFEIMDKHLKRNILGLGDRARFLSNEDGLKEDGITNELLQEKIPRQLSYACVSWVDHIEVTNFEDKALMDGLERFADEHMLYWLEVLSLIGKLDSAHRSIGVVLKLLMSTSSDLHQLLSDASHFISKFYEIVERSALHTYYSALSFTPTDSLLYRRYNKEAEHNIYAIDGGPEKWDVLVANVSHGKPQAVNVVNFIKFSLDGTLLVSFSEKYSYEECSTSIYGNQGKLKIWDVARGIPIFTIRGHMFAVANDFSTAASSQGKNVTLYNVNGNPNGTMFTTSPSSSKIRIIKLALSSESSRVVAASSDGTVWLWDSRNAELIKSFDGSDDNSKSFDESDDNSESFDGSDNSDGSDDNFGSFNDFGGGYQLQFCPTGTRLAYSSTNDIVKLRDGINGRVIADLQCGSWNLFELSGDGSRIVSLSPHDGLKLWNSESGELIAAVGCVGQRVLAISADGSLLATADTLSTGDKVTLWTENYDSLAQIKDIEVNNPAFMTFSLDNILAVKSKSDMIQLYNVNTHSFIHTLPLGGFPMDMSFSPDCTRLAVGTAEGRVYLWDVRVDALGPLSKGNATIVSALTLSRDCLRLACGFENGTVELWGTSPTKQRIASHRAHVVWVEAIGFGPDGGLFASASYDGTIKLWNGKDGLLCGTLETPSGVGALALSNKVLVAAGDSGVSLWSLDTLSLIHTFTDETPAATAVSIAENNALIAIAHCRGVSLLDAENYRTITTFANVLDEIHTMTFLSDNLQLVAQSKEGVFLSFDLINKHIVQGATLDHLIQPLNISLWHDVPMWHCLDNEQHYFTALFSQHKSPLPVLRIPSHIPVTAWSQGSSMIALGCWDEVILLRLPTSHIV